MTFNTLSGYFRDKFSIIGHLREQISNNVAHVQAVSSRPSLQGRPVKEAKVLYRNTSMKKRSVYL